MSAKNEILKKHQNMYCKKQRAHNDAYREGYDRTFGRKPWYVLRDEQKKNKSWESFEQFEDFMDGKIQAESLAIGTFEVKQPKTATEAEAEALKTLTPRRLENDLDRMLTGEGEYCPDECSCEGRCPKTDDLEGT